VRYAVSTVRVQSKVELSAVSESRDNNFDVLRLFAAGLVLLSHSFALTGRHEPLAPHTLGTVGVEIFFVVSGFLVTRSWLGDPSFRSFIGKRIRRIFPGLIVAVLATSLVFGTLYSTESPGRYLLARAPWTYIASNVLLFQHLLIPTVFAGNPSAAVNGSLWTLPIEFRAYVLLGLLGAGALVRRWAMIPIAAGFFGYSLIVGVGSSGRLLAMFAAGSTLYLLREWIVLRADVGAALFVMWLLAFATPLSVAAGMLALPYLIAIFAYRTPRSLRRVVAKGDISYGVYIYAFPVQQSIVAELGTINPFAVALIAAPTVWLLALASWRFVERPFLRGRRAEVRLGEATHTFDRERSAATLL
jgi:peptidoglycan/LPS O-acetylase OafA/YrhL